MAELVMKYQQYAEYKESGVEWLGEIPKDWISTQVKYGYTVVLGKMLQTTRKTNSDLLKPYLKAQNVQPFGIDFTNVGSMWFSADERKRLLLKKKDILVSEGGDVGRAAIWNNEIDECYIQNAINRVRPRYTNDSRFFYYWINYLKATDFINIICNKATIAHYTADKLQGSPLILPSALEQTQIANFLDYETAKIDTLIEKQQTLIQLLKEKRQAVISHAVTKGLNPDAPMKDSGVEWLGQVPEHWEVKGIKRLSEIKRGASPRPIDDQKYFDDDGEYAWTRIADVSRAGMYLDTTTQRLSDLGASLSVKLEAGELFLSIAGTVGKPCITISKACIHDGFVYFPTLKINNKFLFYIFEAGQAYLGLGKMGTQLNLNTETVGGIKIGLPPQKEIESIIEYIENEKARFKKLISKAQKAIQLMQERRTALISAAVTGKIDVRDWQAPDVEAL